MITKIPEEIYNGCREIWVELYSEFAGWSDTSFCIFSTFDFKLTAKIGRWKGEIFADEDGLFHGRWERHAKREICVEVIEETFVFPPTGKLRELLELMDKWIHLRRSPATWKGQISEEDKEILSKGHSQ